MAANRVRSELAWFLSVSVFMGTALGAAAQQFLARDEARNIPPVERAIGVSSAAVGGGAFPEAALPVTRAVEIEKQNILVEMRRRRVVSARAQSWEPSDYALLERMRSAEALDAVALLREQLKSLRGLVVREKTAGGVKTWLTRAGFQRYLFLKSQLARGYFEEMGTDAKWVFMVQTIEGAPVFDDKGVLTPAGEALYNAIQIGETAQWKQADGRIGGNAPGRPKP
ncbi:MAG: hypothetical protein HY551_07340 [Elusimicrobia bacterium]|nr:hypothetical protein [Elusimicrobiota bacterium]